MTFYNVLSALLFIGALRVLLVSIENGNWQAIFASGCYAMIVFNDMLMFSIAVEINKEVEYKARLMLIDLANFLLLALALLGMSPAKNLFDVPLPNLASYLDGAAFWFLLCLYWVLVMAWTHYGRPGQHHHLVTTRAIVLVVFLFRLLLALLTTDYATLLNGFTFACIFLYLIWIRPKLRAKYASKTAVHDRRWELNSNCSIR